MIKNQSYSDDISNNKEILEAYQLKNIEEILLFKQKLQQQHLILKELRKKLMMKQSTIDSLKEKIRKLKDKL